MQKLISDFWGFVLLVGGCVATYFWHRAGTLKPFAYVAGLCFLFGGMLAYDSLKEGP